MCSHICSFQKSVTLGLICVNIGVKSSWLTAFYSMFFMKIQTKKNKVKKCERVRSLFWQRANGAVKALMGRNAGSERGHKNKDKHVVASPEKTTTDDRQQHVSS